MSRSRDEDCTASMAVRLGSTRVQRCSRSGLQSAIPPRRPVELKGDSNALSRRPARNRVLLRQRFGRVWVHPCRNPLFSLAGEFGREHLDVPGFRIVVDEIFESRAFETGVFSSAGISQLATQGGFSKSTFDAGCG